MVVEANANTARLWSFDKPLKRVATHVKAKFAGFYCINGENLIEFPEKNKFQNTSCQESEEKSRETEHFTGLSTTLLSRPESNRKHLEKR
ncbi:hypothetical protein FHEFKHOI_01993 [Candidatus Methanoperedenaceae archaeon GB50]|nr:MAG: hypothetical protein KBONHNOK_00024 [Candidatus Methanoperedenaceae archaeon GB50]CAD7776564.1 hypothetical protein AIOGIFDO_01974 [Candidatus Methanoperedenaceae archaeon GB37]CAD7776740.1 hypothetical protein FHEFKHOI_01993 [Candidatus Methanoperedenaceae archaeon GB50]